MTSSDMQDTPAGRRAAGADGPRSSQPGARSAAADAVPPVARKGRPAGDAENERLRKRLAKAEAKLEQTRAALDIMGKAFALLDYVANRSGC
jgi:hypothetical protein